MKTHGCASRKKGALVPAYTAWLAMKSRCLNPKNLGYKHYGGRGIKVCARWLDSFENFLADMGHTPAGLSLERKENNGDYEPGNCIWATPMQQTRNRSVTRVAELNGETRPVAEWCGIIGVSHSTVRARMGRGWSPEEALSVPIAYRRFST